VYNAQLAMVDWRRRTSQLYVRVRAEADPAVGHALWRAERDAMFRTHPQSPLAPDDPLRTTGIKYWPYNPGRRFELPLEPVQQERLLDLPTSSKAAVKLRLLGHVRLPAPLDFELAVWRLAQYGGGLFVPLCDGTAGTSTYRGGRHLIDMVKGADLGGSDTSIIIDLNFAYHPSSAYDPSWVSPLAPPGNTTAVPVYAGEMLAATQPDLADG
jgi:uncharacterized protein (DUF1684 family)